MKFTNKNLIGLAVLVAGLILLYFGWQSTQSVSGQIAESITGRYSDETIVMLIGGAIATIVGGVLAFGRK